MTTSELEQSTMTPAVSKTYYAVRHVALDPPQDPNEFVERVLQAIWHHPEQLAELAGRWHRRVVEQAQRNMEMERQECREMQEDEAKLKANEGGPRFYVKRSDRIHLTPLREGWLLETTDERTAFAWAESLGGAGDYYDADRDCYNYLLPPDFDPQALRMFTLLDPGQPDPEMRECYHNGPILYIRRAPKGKSRLTLDDKFLIVETDDPDKARGVACMSMGLPKCDELWQYPVGTNLEILRDRFAEELGIAEWHDLPAKVA